MADVGVRGDKLAFPWAKCCSKEDMLLASQQRVGPHLQSLKTPGQHQSSIEEVKAIEYTTA